MSAKYQVIVTRDVTLTQSCLVEVIADSADDAENKALDAAGKPGMTDQWVDDDSFYPSADYYVGGPECVTRKGD